jgi:hypothetical protein
MRKGVWYLAVPLNYTEQVLDVVEIHNRANTTSGYPHHGEEFMTRLWQGNP